ncbi:ATP-binding protein [Streptomyces sp. NPDC001292]|uniref:ATP-binding protein n=1 Tax=Streptomyces sp. NPDC001292 TaxID=3364558 RepID=UPI0036AAF072
MSLAFGQPGPIDGLVGRSDERARLGRLVCALRSGVGQALVVHGARGVGKSVLLDRLVGEAHGCRVLRVAGARPERELAFAGLHQLCAPLMSGAASLPVPQRDALRAAFGLGGADRPQPFLVGLAVMTLLTRSAQEEPLLCVVDDHQWLDQPSTQVLGFVARRLATCPVGVVFGSREAPRELVGLPQMHLRGLRAPDARQLLDSVLTGPLDSRVRELIVAESGGNPLAMLDWVSGASWARLAGGFGLPDAVPLSAPGAEGFDRELGSLPSDTQRLLLLAAAEPSGDAALVWRAAQLLGVRLHALAPAVEAGLMDMSTRVCFRHPLLRSAAYRAASVAERQRAHRALAEATDPTADADRRAWHRSQATVGPDEDVARALEASADRALARGGPAAAAAFLQRAVMLSDDPLRRTERILAAARRSLQAGAYDTTLDLLAAAEASALDERQGARVDLLRGHVGLASAVDSQAPALLLKAARQLGTLDTDLACEAYLTAWRAAVTSGRRAAGTDIGEISLAARALRPSERNTSAASMMLHACSLLGSGGLEEAAPALRGVVAHFTGSAIDAAEELELGWFAQAAAVALWDFDAWHAVLTRQVQLAREAGALDRLPALTACLGVSVAWRGDFATALRLGAECDAVCAETGVTIAPYVATRVAALRGDEDEALPLMAPASSEYEVRGQGLAASFAHWNGATLCNALGRYGQALALADAAAREMPGLFVSLWARIELVEAAARAGQPDPARESYEELRRSTHAGGTAFALGIEARSRALVSTGADAEAAYREAISCLRHTCLRPELARAHLLYGEWLRRENRRGDARGQLRTAHDMFFELGANAFAERARRELLATGERLRRPGSGAGVALTAQETLIARLAADRCTNPEIGAQLFLSARTVEWHLRKVFTKLDIASRRELSAALSRLD